MIHGIHAVTHTDQCVERLLAKLALWHEYTEIHCRSVEAYVLSLASHAVPHWNEEQRHALAMGARLHDIGKLFIPVTILNNTGKLSDQQFACIKSHPERGADLLVSTGLQFPCVTLDAIRYHHASFSRNAGGYPDAVWGKHIPIAARMLSVCDIYDALTTERSYKPAFSPERASKILQEEAGRKLDPYFVELFLRFGLTQAA